MEEYRILTASTAVFLEEFVNDHLRTGWKLQGGVNHCETSEHKHKKEVWSQAMIRDIDSQPHQIERNREYE